MCWNMQAVGEEEPESIGNFRFKACLKSNLDRLYQDEDGRILWMDRNGNTMEPWYKNTNGDRNYDTFTWKYHGAYGGKTVDFPEKDKITGDGNHDHLGQGQQCVGHLHGSAEVKPGKHRRD